MPLSLFAKVLDLGQLEIEGEVRKPQIQVLDSSDSVKRMVKNMQLQQAHSFEEEMLKPQPLPSPTKDNDSAHKPDKQ